MIEYQIVYTVDGEGFTKDKPWIDCWTNDEEEVRASFVEAEEYLSAHYKEYELWVESREVTAWQHLDLT